jgi:hypothetical protein
LSVPLSLQIHILPQLLCHLIATLLAPALAFLTALLLIVSLTCDVSQQQALAQAGVERVPFLLSSLHAAYKNMQLEVGM